MVAFLGGKTISLAPCHIGSSWKLPLIHEPWQCRIQIWGGGNKSSLTSVYKASYKEVCKSKTKSTPGQDNTCESETTQNSMKSILAEIKPHLSHTIISPLLNKMPSYVHRLGIWPIQEQASESPEVCSWI